jgi:hypothetical protein
MENRMTRVLFFVVITGMMAAIIPNTIMATDYYVSPTGNDARDGRSESNAWATFVHANTVLQPGDNLILLDGVYSQRLRPTISGSETGGYITYKAKNNYKAIIAPTTINNDPYFGPAISIFSCPGCSGTWHQPVVHHIAFVGLIARGIGEVSTLHFSSSDNAALDEMTHHIKVQKCGFYGSAQETNRVVISLGNNLLDSLVEDVFAFGRGRKAAQVFGSRNIVMRRAVLRYDYWEGDSYKPNDPRTTFSGYNTQDSVFENIIAIDAGETPAGYYPDRQAFAAAGNSNTAPISGSVRNKYLGLIALNNPGNGLDINGGSGSPNENLVFKNIFIWNSTDDHYGLNVQGNDDGSSYTFITAGHCSLSGIRLDPYPHAPITREVLSNNLSMENSHGGYTWQASQVSLFQENTGINNTSQADIEATYAPDLSSRLLDPAMVTGHERGATIVHRYVNGVQTNTPLWPWPDEDIIKEQMCNIDDLNEVHRWNTSDSLFVGRPGWCETNKTLTEYIWEADGATCPDDICTYGAVPETSACITGPLMLLLLSKP